MVDYSLLIKKVLAFTNLSIGLNLTTKLLFEGIESFADRLHDDTIEFPFLIRNYEDDEDQLMKLLKKKCSALFEEHYNKDHYWPLSSGDLQTILIGVAERVVNYDVQYEREVLNLPDQGLISLDWVMDQNQPQDFDVNDKYPILFIAPGITSSSSSGYILSAICELKTLLKKRNLFFKIVCINYRGISGVPVVTPRLYCAADTSDIKEAASYIRSKHPNRLMFGLGFSMGANLLSLVLAESGHPFCLGVSIGNPYDLLESSRTLERGSFWSTVLAQNCASLFAREDILDVFKNEPNINIDEICQSQRLVEFDELLTRRVFGYKSVNHYYQAGSSGLKVVDINVPYLGLNALDDPIGPKTALPLSEAKLNKNVFLFLTKHGGHLGWFDSIFSLRKRWVDRAISQFLVGMFELYQDNIINLGDQFKATLSDESNDESKISSPKKKSNAKFKRRNSFRQSLSKEESFNTRQNTNILLSTILRILSWLFPPLSISLLWYGWLTRRSSQRGYRHLIILGLSWLLLKLNKWLVRKSKAHIRHPLLH